MAGGTTTHGVSSPVSLNFPQVCVPECVCVCVGVSCQVRGYLTFLLC